MQTVVKNEKKRKSNAVALTAVASSTLLFVGAGCNAPGTPSAGITHGAYKNGTYTAVGHYYSPAGPESLNVSITLAGNTITDANIDPQAVNKKSVFMQDAFIAGYKAQVIGKNIDEVNLVNVSGSSLTPKGFNDALAQVKVQAAAK